MNGSVSGCLLDWVTGDIPSSSTISLTQIGVPGESLTEVDEHGRFVFSSLPPGGYCLGAHNDRYAPLYRHFTLAEGEIVEDLEVLLTPGAFISGRILDEEGYPAQRCHVTLIRAGHRGEQSGYISDSGDHEVAQDGLFSSPALHPGRYFLRFAGILRKPSASASTPSASIAMQQRIFDFLYPNALEIEDAAPFDLHIGQAICDLDIRIPAPTWRSVRGKVTGVLPEDMTDVFVHFTRDVGTLDDFGSAGPRLNADGTFAGDAQPGRYKLAVWKVGPPQPDGYTRVSGRCWLRAR